ncbi:MAG TPA: uroporphyrinogen decarboxylase family protein [Bryobacteraceae bacterium]|nr:uroporphyrinogen decarboxylase family protein [Bryobacteraceae bacterium]
MRREQWELFKQAAKGQAVDSVPVALIVDSPWIPGYLGITHLDYFFDPEVWFQANARILAEFPDVIFLPSWWVEFGMAIEPSGLGCRVKFHADQPPSILPCLSRLADLDGLAPFEPHSDGLAAQALHLYRRHKARILDAGYTTPMVAARGPLCQASFLRGVTEFMTDLVDQPEAAHKLLDFTTANTIRWLTAQAEAIGDSFEGILVLDDIPGFLSRRSYLEFAEPYLKRIAASFPPECVKVYHNDANTRPFLADLPDSGFDVLNWSHNIPADEARAKTGGRMRLMGNVAPLELGVRGTPEQVRAAAVDVLAKTNGGEGVILSFGGGVSPGTPGENIKALAAAR